MLLHESLLIHPPCYFGYSYLPWCIFKSWCYGPRLELKLNSAFDRVQIPTSSSSPIPHFLQQVDSTTCESKIKHFFTPIPRPRLTTCCPMWVNGRCWIYTMSACLVDTHDLSATISNKDWRAYPARPHNEVRTACMMAWVPSLTAIAFLYSQQGIRLPRHACFLYAVDPSTWGWRTW